MIQTPNSSAVSANVLPLAPPAAEKQAEPVRHVLLPESGGAAWQRMATWDAEAICLYIDKNYNDPRLSLQSMAAWFELNEAYASIYFKKHMGVNFSVYVEQRRITLAGELLAYSGYTVADIAELVGYTCVFSFRRAFKRVTGMTPSAYQAGCAARAR